MSSISSSSISSVILKLEIVGGVLSGSINHPSGYTVALFPSVSNVEISPTLCTSAVDLSEQYLENSTALSPFGSVRSPLLLRTLSGSYVRNW